VNRQTLTTDLADAAIARYAGYPTRWLFNERQWAIVGPDLDLLWADVRSGKQAVSDARGLLQTYQEMAEEMGRVTSTTGDPIKPLHGREFHTRNIAAAAVLVARGYSILRTIPADGVERAKFIFNDDGYAGDIARSATKVVREASTHA
jgi:hypothetical protein